MLSGKTGYYIEKTYPIILTIIIFCILTWSYPTFRPELIAETKNFITTVFSCIFGCTVSSLILLYSLKDNPLMKKSIMSGAFNEIILFHKISICWISFCLFMIYCHSAFPMLTRERELLGLIIDPTYILIAMCIGAAASIFRIVFLMLRLLE